MRIRYFTKFYFVSMFYNVAGGRRNEKIKKDTFSSGGCDAGRRLCGGCGWSSGSESEGSTAAASGNREDEVNQEAYQTKQGAACRQQYDFRYPKLWRRRSGSGFGDQLRLESSRYGVGECLFKFDDSMNVVNTLCDEYTVNDEHTEWVFHIRDGVKFSDGVISRRGRWKASFERLFEVGESGSSAPEVYLEKEAELIADNDKGTLTIRTTQPYVDLTKNLAYPVMAIVDVEHTTDYDHGVIGTGPYVATNFREEVGYTMVANENYWDGDVPFGDSGTSVHGETPPPKPWRCSPVSWILLRMSPISMI